MKMRERARLMKRCQTQRTIGPWLRAEFQEVGQGLMQALDDLQQDVVERRGPNRQMAKLLHTWYSRLQPLSSPAG